MNVDPIEALLRRTYRDAPECPPPEAFLRASMESLSGSEQAAIERHADDCPACSAERDMAGQFDAPATDIEARRVDVDAIVGRLRSPVPTARRFPAGLALAAALAVVAVGLFALRPSAPSLPPRLADPVVRSGRVEISRPIGELVAFPAELQWNAVEGADRYFARIFEVDGAILFEFMTGDTSTDLPSDALSAMHPSVVYTWEVEALDEGGRALARSERTSFRVKPGVRR